MNIMRAMCGVVVERDDRVHADDHGEHVSTGGVGAHQRLEDHELGEPSGERRDAGQ